MKELIVGNRLKLARVEKNLTQQELAELVGVTRQTIGLLEAGKYNPTLNLCLLISRATGKSLDELFWIEGGRDEKLVSS
jgi:putative transcriptional regulator